MNKLKIFKGKKFHFIGIGGVSMSALAQMLKHRGFYVQGSDENVNGEVKKLARKKIKVCLGHSKDNVLGVDVVVYSSAVNMDNPELVQARKLKLIVIKRAELLGLIADEYKTVISIAGSHGKTTTTAMISEIFINAGLKPTVHIGGKLKSINSNLKLGNKKYFVTENCEYKDNFLFIKPDVSVILNLDSDHLDYFKSLEGVKKSFYKFAQGVKNNGLNLVFDSDSNLDKIRDLDSSVQFGYCSSSDFSAMNIREYKKGYYSFDVALKGCKIGRIRLNIIGKHNVINALASVFVGFICGIDFDTIKSSLESFSGVERRCDKVGTINGADVYHDYAHHPAQISKMIETAKGLKGENGRIITIFEPHTFSRTKYLLEEFVKSFCDSDYVFLLPVYSAREVESDGLTSLDLMNETKKYIEKVDYVKTYRGVVEEIKRLAKKGDIVLVLGAGSVENVSKMMFV